MKRFLVLFSLVLVLMCSVSLVASAEVTQSGTYGTNITWTFDSDGVLTVSGKGAMTESPTTEYWNSFSWEIKRIIIEEGITTVAPNAFSWCSSVTEVEIPSTVTKIGDYAFGGCDITGELVLPSGLKTLGTASFAYNKNMTGVVLPDGLTTIGELAFSECESLVEVIMPDTVTSLGQIAFNKCYKLENVKLPAKITEIPLWTFQECESLTQVALPSTVKTIGEGAFIDCKNLTTINIPSGVTVMGNEAFRGCESLVSIDVPAGVKELHSTFFECWSLESINVSSKNTAFSSVDGILYNKDKSMLLHYPSGHKAESYTLPSTIGSTWKVSCLENARNLKNIYVAPGAYKAYKSIDGVLFRDDSLVKYPAGRTDTKYVVPEGTDRIESDAFAYNEHIQIVEFSDSVTDMDTDAFRYCKNLYAVDLGNGYENNIGSTFFGDCHSLSIIIMPRTVTKISSTAFYNCGNISHIYYNGTEEEWNNIPIGSDNGNIFGAEVHFGDDKPILYDFVEPTIKYGTAYFRSGNGEAAYTYDDMYLYGTSYTYNHDLARMTMRLALSAFSASGTKTQYANAEKLLKDLGFKGIKYNEWYTQPPELDSIAVITGRKHIKYPGGNYTVIAVAVRGGNYKDEWGGNFTVGTDKHHEGFATARDQVVAHVKEYIKNERIGGDIKLWITGYSRAAATTNLTAAYFDEHCDEIGSLVSLEPRDIYAYCFETPAGVVNPSKDKLYTNIFSIVNHHDFVPKVAMKKWGFDRYGITKYLPSAYTNSNYTNSDGTGLKDRMEDLFKTYSGVDYVVDDFYYYSFDVNPLDDKDISIKKSYKSAQGIFFDNLMDKLATEVGSTAVYEKEYQDAFEFIGQAILGQGRGAEFGQQLLDSLIDKGILVVAGGTGAALANPVVQFNPALKWGTVALGTGSAYLTLRAAVKDTFKEMGNIKVSNTAIDGIVKIIAAAGPNDILTLCCNLGEMKQSHFPELCMAWLDTMSERDFVSKPLREMIVNCPVDFEVYDSEDNLVAAVRNNIPQEVEGSDIVPFIDENGQKIVYLPHDEEYRIEVIATDNGEVTYTVQEQDLSTGKTRIYSYNNMTVRKGNTLTGTAENLAETTGKYNLTSNNVSVAKAEYIHEATPLSVTVNAQGNGGVKGEGIFYKREFAQVFADPAQDETFLGWYNGDDLVSDEAEYRFQVTEDTSLTAKFTENTCQVIFEDDENYVVDTVRTIKGNKVILPENPRRGCDRFDGFYQDAQYTIPLDPDAVYSEDATVYAKFIKPLQSGDSYYFTIDGSEAEVAGSVGGVSDVVITDSLDGYAPVRIADDAFGSKRITSVFIPATVTQIGNRAFYNCPQLTDIYYVGDAQSWSDIVKGAGNDSLEDANIHYLSPIEAKVYRGSYDMDDMSVIEISPEDSTHQIFAGKYELYYSPQRDVYVGVVSKKNVDGNATKVEYVDGAPVTFVYGNADGNDNYTSIENAIRSSDLLNIKLALIGSKTLEGKTLIASDLNADGRFNSGDLLSMKLYMTKGTAFPVLR